MTIWLEVKKVHKDAVLPFKNFKSVGLDLTLVALAEQQPMDPSIVVYDTGLQIRCSTGFAFDIVERSSLWKKGYALANSVGVIDPDYRGNLMVVLRRMNDEAEDLELPFRGVQLLPRQVFDVTVSEVTELDDTLRGSGGFGSTGV